MILSKPLRKNTARRSAFTLLEVLVVVAILVILAGTAVIYIPQYIEDSKIKKAQLECEAWEKAVNTYYLNQNSYPSSLQDPVVQSYIEDGANKVKDPWNGMYQVTEQTDSNGNQIPVVFTKHPKTGQRITKRGLNT
jgi:general secretion pathway protein G